MADVPCPCDCGECMDALFTGKVGAIIARRLAFPTKPMVRTARWFGVSRQACYRAINAAAKLGFDAPKVRP